MTTAVAVRFSRLYQGEVFSKVLQQQGSELVYPILLRHTRLLSADDIDVMRDHAQDAVAFLAMTIRTQPRYQVIRRHFACCTHIVTTMTHITILRWWWRGLVVTRWSPSM